MSDPRQRYSTPAILLRKATCGESDVVATFFSLQMGKISCFAKAAKSSMKRFGGGIDFFSVVEITVEPPSRGELYLLQESTLRSAFDGIAQDILKTAHAGYWCELVNRWSEPAHPSPGLFALMETALGYLNQDQTQAEVAGILFQMQLLRRIGLSPELTRCGGCGLGVREGGSDRLGFDLEKGWVLCHKCRTDFAHVAPVSKGTVMQLDWLRDRDFHVGRRMRFTAQALAEGSELLEAFVPRHLGCMPRSLSFLKRIRSEAGSLHRSGDPLGIEVMIGETHSCGL